MTNKLHVPQANRSPKGTGDDKEVRTDTTPHETNETDNLREKGQTANTKQNRTHQGYQQDR